jgi:hypothetical protein
MNFRSDAASVVKGSPTLIRRTEFVHFSFNVASSEQRCSIDIEPNQVIVSQDNERGADLVISGPRRGMDRIRQAPRLHMRKKLLALFRVRGFRP